MRRNIRNLTCLFFLATLMLVACLCSQAAPVLISLSDNSDLRCLELGLKVLGGQEVDESIAPLIRCLKTDSQYGTRGGAKLVLQTLGQRAIPELVKALDDPDEDIFRGATVTLGMIGRQASEALPTLRAHFKILGKQRHSHNDGVPSVVAVAIGRIGDVDFLMRIMQGKEAEILPSYGAWGLGAAGPFATAVLPELVKAVQSPDANLAYYAVEAIGEIGPAANSVVPQFVEMRPSLSVAPLAVGKALQKIGTPEALAAAQLYRKDFDRSVRKMKWENFFEFWGGGIGIVGSFIIGALFGLGALTDLKLRPKTIPSSRIETFVGWLIC